MAEWLRRWTANPLCSARVGSNPILVEFFFLFVTTELNLSKFNLFLFCFAVGVLGAPRTCLHSILSLLEYGSDSACHYSNPKLAELCYKLIYQLCGSRQLSTPTLRYLRSNHDFFFTQLSRLPFNAQLLQDELEQQENQAELVLNTRQVALVHQQAWFLKSLAIELRLTSLNHQRSHAQRIVNLLLNEPTNQMVELGHVTNPLGSDTNELKSDFDYLHEKKRKVLVLLDTIDFKNKEMPALDLNFFDQSAMEQAIQSCETKVCHVTLSCNWLVSHVI